MGGNDAAIVLGDADPALVAAGIFGAAFRNGGQVCGAVKRVYVHDDIYTPFCSALAEWVKGVVVGDGLQAGVTIGPVQNRAQYEKATALLADARQRGRILAQGACPSGPGYFVPPSLIADLDDEHPLFQIGPLYGEAIRQRLDLRRRRHQGIFAAPSDVSMSSIIGIKNEFPNDGDSNERPGLHDPGW